MSLKYKIGLLFIAICTISCEEFLEEDPNVFISNSNFYKTASDARTATDGVYKMLNDGGALSLYGRFWEAIDIATDDVTSRTNRTNFNPWFEHTINGEHVWFESWNQYQGLWQGISRANDVIQNVPSIDMDQAEKDAIIGEARALRALFYYHLVRAWGDMPKVTSNYTLADFSLPRSDVDEIYNEIIIPDLLYAETVCKDELHYGRITKWTAKVILADVYLNRAGWRRTSQGEFVQGDPQNWTLAKNKAKEVIDNSPHSLNTEPIVNGMHTTPAYGVAWYESQAFSKESMLELASINVSGNGNWITRECGPAGNGAPFWGAGGNKPLEGEGITLNVNQLKFPVVVAVGFYIPTPDLWNAFEAGDERRDWSLMTRYTTPAGDNFLCQPTFRKYVDIDFYLNAPNTSFQNTNNNIILYRYADALLIYAEAANETDGAPSTEAYTAINDIRDRAGLDDLSELSQSEFRNAVWKERRLEFNAECKRKFDLVRTNRLATETASIEVDWKKVNGSLSDYTNRNSLYTGSVAWPENEWLMPIPQSQIELNVDNNWEQNKGY
ncbi:RagB/SusD family nutrient uptake outer membrane protein [Algibacter sp.]|nr:RagB/SusD family nutrient uptake outer membrane protein [Algibacter sp.]MDA9069804.1 RagB/SusD family nutrient uptake outer membrane protein [Algibacter sp.]MDA9775228.1 RagB/SusD family nutrient uptake outer membrane protein [Algibacter sp.]MDC1321769.1 RagB/SusD family nutrient uptake outer membrane protein [bacterium]